MQQRLIRLVILTTLLAASAGCRSMRGKTATPAGAVVTYRLQKPGFVTVAIDDEHGQRVRNLVACAWREAGRHLESWDGLDDVGRSVPPGLYHWRGIVHGPLTSHFQGAFDSPGNPPWLTFQQPAQWYIRGSGSGGWLSDHECPLCAYSTGERVYLGAAVAEAGHSIIEVDPDGNKRWGTLWLGLSGASAITVANNILYVAGEKGWLGDSLTVNRLDCRTHLWIPNPPAIQKERTTTAFIQEKSADFAGIRGMVVTPRFIVLSLADRGRLACFDKTTAAHVKDVPLPGAGAILQFANGDILGISSNHVVKVDLDNGQHQAIITANLIQPSGLAVDSKGNIYVTDLAPSEQCVKVFAADGKLLHRIGKLGGRHEGRFDPLAMSQPTAVAVDNRDQVWVTEHDYLPKRVSVWSTDGKLIRDYIGPPHYGGGGGLDPQTPSRAYYTGMESTWYPWPQTSTLRAVLFRPEEHTDLPYPLSDVSSPHHPIYRDGALYLIHDDGWALPGVFIGEVKDDHLVPRVIFGSLSTLCNSWRETHADFIAKFSAGGKQPAHGVFLWSDTNGDGRAEPSEVTVQPDWRFGTMWALRTWPGLTLHAISGNQIVELSPHNPDGPLRYDLTDARLVPLPEITQKKGIGALAQDLDGNLIVNCGGGENQGDPTNVLLGLAPDGRVRWTYPNPYPANWHNSPRPDIGDIQHTLNVEGIAHVSDAVGDVFQLNGNKGLRYLFTTDGLFVGNLFGDMRVAPLQQTVTEVKFDMPMQQYSLGDECFFGWFGRVSDGRFLQILGKDSANIFEVRGLETLRRLKGGTIRLAKAAEPVATQDKAMPQTVEIGLGGWSETWMKLHSYGIPADKPLARFSMAATADRLTIVVDVQDDSPFQNHGEDATTLFHTGDAIDLRLATNPTLPTNRTQPGPGDQRFIIAMFKDKPIVMRYEFAVPGTKEPVQFRSPAGEATVDKITVLQNAAVDVRRETKRYRITIRLPWTDLGLSGLPTGILRGDVGVIMSDPTGNRVVARDYHFDRGSQVVSDIPSEVRVNPAHWGRFQF